MGWASGSRLVDDVIKGLKKSALSPADREVVYRVLIPTMEDFDWDAQDDCVGSDPAFDAVLKELHPDWELD